MRRKVVTLNDSRYGITKLKPAFFSLLEAVGRS
jgi:hypothetical protein